MSISNPKSKTQKQASSEKAKAVAGLSLKLSFINKGGKLTKLSQRFATEMTETSQFYVM